MNYSLPSFEELLRRATDGVKEEWLRDQRTAPIAVRDSVQAPIAVRDCVRTSGIAGASSGGGTAFSIQFETSLRMLYEMKKESSQLFLPQPEQILAPFKVLRPTEVKVIITAQDPYPRRADACGVAFQSFSPSIPYSARRINDNLVRYRHISADKAASADYRSWLSQGVLLTNVSLTTVEGETRAHSTLWKEVTQCALQLVPKNSVAILLGQDARTLSSSLRSSKTITHAHPAARNDEFMEKDIFGEANEALQAMGLSPIDWTPGPWRKP